MTYEKVTPQQGTKGTSKVAKPPAYSEEHERAVLGAIMLDPDRYGKLIENGFISVFYLNKHSIIANAMYDLHVVGSPVDSINVVESLRERGKLEKIGGAYYITELMQYGSIDPQHDLNKLKEIVSKRQIRESLIQLHQAGFNRPLDDIINDYLKISESFISNNARDTGINSIMAAPMEFKEMVNCEYKRPEDFIRGILPIESILLLYGQQKVGKSLLALNLAIHLAAGEPWFHLQISKPHKTLFISAEGGLPMLIDRIRQLNKGEIKPKPGNLYPWAIPPIDILSSVDFGGLVAVIEDIQPEVIILDPLTKIHMKDENSNNEMAEVLGRIRQLITGHNRSLILNHHARKAGDTSRGASSIAGEVDSIIRLEWENKEDHIGNRRLYFEDLRHDEPPPDLYLTIESETLSFMSVASKSIELIEQILNENGKTMLRSDLRKELEDRLGKSRRTAYNLIEKAYKQGEIYTPAESNKVCLK